MNNNINKLLAAHFYRILALGPCTCQPFMCILKFHLYNANLCTVLSSLKTTFKAFYSSTHLSRQPVNPLEEMLMMHNFPNWQDPSGHSQRANGQTFCTLARSCARRATKRSLFTDQIATHGLLGESSCNCKVKARGLISVTCFMVTSDSVQSLVSTVSKSHVKL